METSEGSRRIWTFARYQHLAHKGDVQDKVFELQSGWACQYYVLPDGRRQITALFLPGDFCEPQWMLSGVAKMPIVALTPVRALELPLDAIHAASRDGVMRLLSGMLQAVERQTDLIISLGRRSAKERIKCLLLELYARLTRAGETDNGRCLIPITQQDIGDLVGLTGVHVNRVLQDLREEGTVYLHGKTLVIRDMAGPASDGQSPMRGSTGKAGDFAKQRSAQAASISR